MTKQRIILHADMNSCYASIEQARNPNLRHRPVAVCGDPKKRSGIILAKSQEAKRCGVKTGEAIWQAQMKCPDLVTVPANYPLYFRYSKAAHQIYRKYTENVEPYGIDECWLDVSGTRRLFGTGEEIAEILRERFRTELSITLSVGISTNKIYAKLGSDYKKPDAQTVMTKDLAYTLPVGDLLFVGAATQRKLAKYGITTIGELGETDPSFLHSILGINGEKIRIAARGEDVSPVMTYHYKAPIKSVSHGITFPCDLTTEDQIRRGLLALSLRVSKKLVENRLLAKEISVEVRDTELLSHAFYQKTAYPLSNAAEIGLCGFRSFLANWDSGRPVRALTIRALTLVSEDSAVQLQSFDDFPFHEKKEKAGRLLLYLKERFGAEMTSYASIKGYADADVVTNRRTLPENSFTISLSKGYNQT